MSNFEIGNIYSRRDKFKKIYYMAIGHKTLVTFKDGKFGQFTVKKEGMIKEDDISVSEICEYWEITTEILDTYMYNHFQPDETAKLRARKEKETQILDDIDLVSELTSINET